MAAGPYLAGALTVLFWGATPAATVLVAREMPALLVGPARLLLSAVLLLPLLLLWRLALPRDRAGWLALAVSGAIGFAATFVLQAFGFAHTSTTHGALILAAAPVLTGLWLFLLARQRPPALWCAGSLLALSGEGLLIFGRNLASGGHEASLFGDLFVLLGVIAVSIGFVAGARLAERIGMFGATTGSILFGALFTLPVAPAILDQLPRLSLLAAGSLAFLVLFCTVLGYAAWFWALGRGGVASVSQLQFAQPLVSLVIAVTLLSETVSASLLLAVVLILAGVLLCRRATAVRSSASAG